MDCFAGVVVCCFSYGDFLGCVGCGGVVCMISRQVLGWICRAVGVGIGG